MLSLHGKFFIVLHSAGAWTSELTLCVRSDVIACGCLSQTLSIESRAVVLPPDVMSCTVL